MGRATQGVRLINISDSDEIAAVTKVDHEDDENENSIEGTVTEGMNDETSTGEGETDNSNETPTDNKE